MDASRTAGEQQLRRLRSFLSPQAWRLIANSSDEELEFRQREIVVVFCDLRGFTAFVHTAPSAVIVSVLADYHRCVGPVILEHNGILERFTGDGLMVYFDDAPLADQAQCAVRMAVRMRDLVANLAAGWRRRGHQLDVGIGIALGPATLGPFGFDQRRDYAAIGPVTNLSSRLCAEAAAGQVLVTDRLYAAVGDVVDGQPLGARLLKGFDVPVEVYDVRGVSPPTPSRQPGAPLSTRRSDARVHDA